LFDLTLAFVGGRVDADSTDTADPTELTGTPIAAAILLAKPICITVPVMTLWTTAAWYFTVRVAYNSN